MGKRSDEGAGDRPTGRRALGILARFEVSAARLAELLRRQGLGAAEVASELEVVERLGALDDVRSASARARALVEKGAHGRAGMQARLVAAGYPARLVEQVLATAIEDADWEELPCARALLAHRRPAGDAKGAARLGRFLVGRGFTAETVAALLPGLEGTEGPG